VSFFSKLADKVTSIGKEALNADRALQVATSGLIELARETWDPVELRPGEPLKLLLAGYNGTRNTGADVRVEEMIRQFRHLLGDEHVDLSILVQDPELTRGYFATVKQLEMPRVFPKYIYDTIRPFHGVIACEGSMFKSKFADALSTMMTGSLGLAVAGRKLSIAYGGEAGQMSQPMEDMVKRYLEDVFVITRNENSRRILGDLGIPTKLGTDTAWTFEPAPRSVGEQILRDHGWDGEKKVLMLVPINPFWWPVRPDVVRGVAHAVTGAWDDAHYASVYFHHDAPDVHEKQDAYLDAIANAAARFREETDCFVVCFGSEQLDRTACEGLRDRLGEAAVIISDEYDMFEMVSVGRCASWMVSSRYHAIVTTMPGDVLSVGVTMDERIRNLMIDRGHPEMALEVDDPHLEEGILRSLRRLRDDPEPIRQGMEDSVVRALEMMGRMGMMFVEEVRANYPSFPIRPGLGKRGDPWEHLPPLSESLAAKVAAARETK